MRRPLCAVRFESPGPDRLRQVAGLRWELVEGDLPEPHPTRRDFVEGFLRWCEAHRASHLCVVGVDGDDAVVAFGFVALTPRVPSPDRAERCSGDVQSVFVTSALRNAGIGGRLIDRLVALARERGAEHVTVHSSAGAVTAYQRAGFARDPLVLNQIL